MGNSNNEFDAFGPWIYEIDEQNLVPPLFSDYEYLKNKALMMFKIPRQIDRRVANPNMHLYDMLITVLNRELIILSRDEDNLQRLKVAIPDIFAISRSESLLDGKVELYIKGDVVSFDYNTTSAAIIVKFINLVRSLQRRSTKSLLLAPIEYDLRMLDMPYYTLVERIRENEPEFELIAFQPSIENPKNSKWMKRIKRMFIDDSFASDEVISCSSAFLTNKKELICINRSLLNNDDKHSNYSYSYSYLPISSIKRSKIEVYSKVPCLDRLIIGTVSHEFSFIINDKQAGIDILNKRL